MFKVMRMVMVTFLIFIIFSGCQKNNQGKVIFYITNAGSSGNSGVGCMVNIGGQSKTWFQHNNVSSASIDCDSDSAIGNHYVVFVLPNGTYDYEFFIGVNKHVGNVKVDGECRHVTLSF